MIVLCLSYLSSDIVKEICQIKMRVEWAGHALAKPLEVVIPMCHTRQLEAFEVTRSRVLSHHPTAA